MAAEAVTREDRMAFRGNRKQDASVRVCEYAWTCRRRGNPGIFRGIRGYLVFRTATARNEPFRRRAPRAFDPWLQSAGSSVGATAKMSGNWKTRTGKEDKKRPSSEGSRQGKSALRRRDQGADEGQIWGRL